MTAEHSEVPAADVVATWNAESSALALFAVNRAQDDSVLLERDPDLPVNAIASVETLSDADRTGSRDTARCYEVALRRNVSARLEGGRFRVELPAVSWTPSVFTVGNGNGWRSVCPRRRARQLVMRARDDHGGPHERDPP